MGLTEEEHTKEIYTQLEKESKPTPTTFVDKIDPTILIIIFGLGALIAWVLFENFLVSASIAFIGVITAGMKQGDKPEKGITIEEALAIAAREIKTRQTYTQGFIQGRVDFPGQYVLSHQDGKRSHYNIYTIITDPEGVKHKFIAVIDYWDGYWIGLRPKREGFTGRETQNTKHVFVPYIHKKGEALPRPSERYDE